MNYGIPLAVLTACFAALMAMLWPVMLYDIVVVSGGLGRKIQPITDFRYQCRRIAGPDLQACEDMWLSERTRQLFLACSDSLSRSEWMPNIHRLNASGRGLEDKIIALDVDKPSGRGFEYRVLATPGFPGVNGDGRLHLVGLSGVDRDDHVELYLVNAKPSVDMASGELLNQEGPGANWTIEHFKTIPDTEKIEFIQTFSDPHITTPNNIATEGDGSFYFTNDHGPNKVGIGHKLSPFLKDGEVGYCNQGGCRIVERGHAFPNGLAFGKDGLLYVPSSFSGNLQVYETQPDGGIKKVNTVKIPYPLDNLSLDGNGDLWVPGLPDISKTLGGFDNPLGPTAPSTVFRIHKTDNGEYKVDKVLEDAEGKVLPGATTIVHDATTGRLFLSGVYSPFITVCEPEDISATSDGRAGEVEHGEL